MTDEKLTNEEQSKLAEEAAIELDEYRKNIEQANYHIREAIRLRDEAFKKFGVEIPLPFEFADQ